MTLDELSSTLATLGVEMSARLVVDAPAGLLAPEVVAAIASHKPAILLRLARQIQWEALSRERWGPGFNDSTPGLDNPGRPFDPETFARAMDDADDPYARAERDAIRGEG